MSCTKFRGARGALLVMAVAATGAIAAFAQRASAVDQEEGRIVTISPSGDAGGELEEGTAQVEEQAAERPALWLGIQGQPLQSDVLRTHLQLAEGVGVVVEQVVPESPAEKAGLRKHDVLLDVNGEQISDMTVLQQAVAHSEGKPLELKVIRLAKEMTLSVTPEPTPADLQIAAAPSGADGGLPGMPMDQLQAMLEQMQQQGAGGGFRILGPGAIINGQSLDLQGMPQGVQVTIARDGEGPATITVKRGDESWKLKDNDPDALAKLPEDVRPFVEQMLNGGPSAGLFHQGGLGGGLPGQMGGFNFNFDAPQLDAVRHHAGAAAGAAVEEAQELNQSLIQRLESLEQHLQQLEQQLQEKSGDGAKSSTDPSNS